MSASAAVAAPCGDPSALRLELQREARRADLWNLAWRITYTAGAVVQLGAAASGQLDRDETDALWVGGTKAALGALSQWFAPLRIPVPPPTGDACTDRSMLRGAAERAAFEERKNFWASHIGGLIVNLAGAAVLAERTSLENGLLSIATGYPIGLLHNYTMPRASWRRVRQLTWTAYVTTGDDRHALVVAGSF